MLAICDRAARSRDIFALASAFRGSSLSGKRSVGSFQGGSEREAVLRRSSTRGNGKRPAQFPARSRRRVSPQGDFRRRATAPSTAQSCRTRTRVDKSAPFRPHPVSPTRSAIFCAGHVSPLLPHVRGNRCIGDCSIIYRFPAATTVSEASLLSRALSSLSVSLSLSCRKISSMVPVRDCS